MKAVHIFSHNAVLLRDEKGRKWIATGKGIGFMKGKGDRINRELIRNMFVEDRNYRDKRTD
ncbi:CAT RNA binding domain-containing protein [Carnobacteriaceae bacterium 52-44]